ncbi:MAG: YihY/virulence factor BrkB family protein, partial [Deltaproteobacteria bacterium]|nr:YihY/virulence factor BrkB family protein [Deltaproteobacteria bacterium]
MSNRPSPALLLEHLVARLPGPAGPAGAAMVRVLADAAADFRRGRLHRDAAALAYFGLLSLIPLLSLGAWVVRVLAAPVLASPERTERLHAAIRSATEHAYPLLADQAAAVLGEIAATSDTGGLLGLAATLLAAGLLFRALSVSLSEVYGVERSRGFLGARIVAAVLLVSGG